MRDRREWIESGGVQVPGQKFHKNVSSVGGEDGSEMDAVHAAAWNERCRFPGNLSAPRGRYHSLSWINPQHKKTAPGSAGAVLGGYNQRQSTAFTKSSI